VLIIGDKDVGKSSLWWTLLEGEFPDPDQVSRLTKEKMNHQEVLFGDVTYNLIFTEDDTSGENTDAVREQLLDTDLVILLFSIIDVRSFQNAKIKWLGLARENSVDLPVVFVGNKIDLREEAAAIPGLAPVTTEEGEQAVEESEGNGYTEISAKQKTGLKDLLRTVVDGVLDARNKKFEREKLRDDGKAKCLMM